MEGGTGEKNERDYWRKILEERTQGGISEEKGNWMKGEGKGGKIKMLKERRKKRSGKERKKRRTKRRKKWMIFG